MKYIIVVLLLLSPIVTTAQKHVLYGDIGTTSYNGFRPGGSLTYNYKLVKYVGAGIGMQGYNYGISTFYTPKFTPSLFVDLRFNIRPEKKNQFFAFIDLGVNFYKPNVIYTSKDSNIVYNPSKNNGFHTGWGLGYFHRITKRGSGVYMSLKLTGNSATVKGYHKYYTQKTYSFVDFDALLVYSIGFRL